MLAPGAEAQSLCMLEVSFTRKNALKCKTQKSDGHTVFTVGICTIYDVMKYSSSLLNVATYSPSAQRVD